MAVASAATQSVFLSHASRDAALAQHLCALLEGKGVRCWIAPRDVQPGCSYPDEIVRGIDECASLILLTTSAQSLHITSSTRWNRHTSVGRPS